jgi:hypothetical protein
MPGKKKEGWKKERAKKEIGCNTRISKVLPSLPPSAMAEQDWTPSTVTLSHLQNGFMAATELEACRVPADLAFPTPMEGYVVSFTAFYERGFGMPPHRFLHSLLRYYSLELHHLTPSGVLHIAAFVTLCEAYQGIDPELNQWKYFFHNQRPQDLKVELMISGGVVCQCFLHQQDIGWSISRIPILRWSYKLQSTLQFILVQAPPRR